RRSTFTRGRWTPNQVTSTARTRRSSWTIPSNDAATSVSSMLASRVASAAKSIPIPAISAVSSGPRENLVGFWTRLKGMTEPRCEGIQGGADVGRPLWVCILRLEPGTNLAKLVRGRRQGDAVGKIKAPVAEREDLASE